MKLLGRLFSRRERFQYEGENALLVQAMHGLTLADNPENRKKMYDVLLGSTLLIPTSELPAASAESKEPHTVALKLTCITDDQGHKLTPAFTDLEALRNWDPNTPCLSAQARGFFETISNYFREIQGVVLNPSDPIRKMIRPTRIILRSEFEMLARGLVPTVIARDFARSEVPAGLQDLIRPSNHPIPLAVSDLLRECAKDIPEVATLHFFSIAYAHGSPQPAVGVGFDREVSKEREQAIVQTLWRGVTPALIELKTLDFVVLTGTMAARAENAGAKIYERL